MLGVRFSRFIPFVGVGAVLIAWMVCINLLLLVLDNNKFMVWLPDRSSGVGYLLESRQRVQAAEALMQSIPDKANRPLVAVVGISDVREGIRLEILSAQSGDRWRFIGVAGAGAGFASVEEQASLLLESNLKPEIVIIGISPMQMIETEDFERGAAKTAGDDIISNARSSIRGALWFVQRRSDLIGWLDRNLLEVRSDIYEGLGQKSNTDTRSPWRPLLRTLRAEHYPEHVLRGGLAFIEASGARELSTFARSQKPFTDAGNLIKQFEVRGSRVIIMFMPRHPWLEAVLPRSADDFIAARLRVAVGNPQLQVLDYSDTVPAKGFIDLVHLNTAGGESFSRQLANDLLEQDMRAHPWAPARP